MTFEDKINNTFEYSNIVRKYCDMLDEMTDEYGIPYYETDELQKEIERELPSYEHEDNHPLDQWTENEYTFENVNVSNIDEVYSIGNENEKEYLFFDNVEKIGLNRYVGILKFGSHLAPTGVTYKKTYEGMELLSLFEGFDDQINITSNRDENKLYTKEDEDNVYYTDDFTHQCELIVEKEYDNNKYGVIQTKCDTIEVLFEYTNYGICIKEYDVTYNNMIDDDKMERYLLFNDSYTVTNTIKNTFNNVNDITVEEFELILTTPNVTSISTSAPIKYKVSIELDSNILCNTVIDIYCMYTREEVEDEITEFVLDSMVYEGMDIEDVEDMRKSALQRTGQYNVCINQTIKNNVDSSPFENSDIVIDSEGTFEEDIEMIMKNITNYLN